MNTRTHLTRPFLAASILFAITACSSPRQPTAARVPGNLQPPATERLAATFAARGWQVYECRSGKADAKPPQWAFVAPEADLFDAQEHRAGKHYAGPQWESADGSKTLGTVVASADAPEPGAIAWLLLRAKNVGPAGAFAQVTSVQRLNTHGGAMPAAAECTAETAGKQRRVKYTADYVMYRAS